MAGAIFTDVTEGSGFEYSGHGKCIAVADLDRDGDLDLYQCLVYAPNRMLRNEGGMHFSDITTSCGAGNSWDSHGAVFVDLDGDSYLELFVTNNVEEASIPRGNLRQPNSFYYINDEIAFIDKADSLGLAGGPFNYSAGITTADYDLDGDLDIFVAEGGYFSGPDCANSLYRNDGDGRFTDVAAQAGVADTGNGYCCSFADYDLDGDADLFVGNLNPGDTPASRYLYRNNGDGTFSELAGQLGLASKGYCVSCFWGDIDNDGDLDLYLGNSGGLCPQGHERNRLYLNNGDGTFTDISARAGVDSGRFTRGVNMGDVNGDGWLDIYVTNSMAESQLYLNNGDLTFREVAAEAGCSVFYGHGVTLADLDNDFDLDLAVGNWRRIRASNPGCWKLFRNDTPGGRYLKVRVAGSGAMRSAVGAKVYVYRAGPADRGDLVGFREVAAGSGTFPGNPLEQHFGLPGDGPYDVVAVLPGGCRLTAEGVRPGEVVELVESLE
ncbi:MAG: VCBS repeat-containing protein [Candidatus Glassbacteria bacterium]|nr:VCBS repeat-containing protein [Candidatus Glassbacteria bacterium]